MARRPDWTNARTPSRAVIDAVSQAQGLDPTDLDRPLYDAIDPDALDELFFEGAASDTRVSFDYHGYRVTVHGDGDVTLEPPDASPR